MSFSKKQESFVLHHGQKMFFEELSSDESRGKLIMAIFDYHERETEPTKESLGDAWLSFRAIKEQLDRDGKKYAERCQKNAENGRKGGRPQKRTVSQKTEWFLEEPKKADNDSDNDSDNDYDNGGDNDIAPTPSREVVIEILGKEGIPCEYIAKRYGRATAWGGNLIETLRSWWASDRCGWSDSSGKDPFFETAVKNSYGDDYPGNGSKS